MYLTLTALYKPCAVMMYLPISLIYNLRLFTFMTVDEGAEFKRKEKGVDNISLKMYLQIE